MATILYRGPIETARLDFIIEASSSRYTKLDMIWLVPRPQFRHKRSEGWLSQHPGLASFRTVASDRRSTPATISWLKRHVDRSESILAVGFTALPYAKWVAEGPMVWFVNGIPEERLLHASSLPTRAMVAGMWRFMRWGRNPDLVVPVSHPMVDWIDRHIPGMDYLVVPTCIDLGLFRPPGKDKRKYLTYLGSGAPWQGLDHLASVWKELARLDRDFWFQVISRDPRAMSTISDLPPDRVVMTRAAFQDVPRMLWTASAGFMLREPHIVNKSSYPTKAGEYLAAGVPLILTDIGWDIAELVNRHKCGRLVEWTSDPIRMAQNIYPYLQTIGPEAERASLRASRELDRRRWALELQNAMP